LDELVDAFDTKGLHRALGSSRAQHRPYNLKGPSQWRDEGAVRSPMANMPIKYATIHLTIERELPPAGSLPDQLRKMGLSDQTQEACWVIAYDSSQGIRTVVEVARGNYHEIDVSLPAVLSVPLLAGCDRFQIAHNHPTSDPAPTVLDVDLTRQVLAAANTCGLYFEDHIILAPGFNYYSFFESGRLGPGRKVGRGHERAKDPPGQAAPRPAAIHVPEPSAPRGHPCTAEPVCGRYLRTAARAAIHGVALGGHTPTA
jgi:hypothetical protein